MVKRCYRKLLLFSANSASLREIIPRRDAEFAELFLSNTLLGNYLKKNAFRVFSQFRLYNK
jgi:hypothetical protein